MELYVLAVTLNNFHDYMGSLWLWVGFIKSEGDLAQQKRTKNAGKILKQKMLNLALQHSCHRNVGHDDHRTHWDWLA
jgi:hypothetical protein